MGGPLSLLLLVLLSVAVAAGAEPDRPVPSITIEPRAVYTGSDVFSEPMALVARAGRIHVLDAMEHVVWTIDTASGDISALEIEHAEQPYDLFFACGGALHVVDPLRRGLLVQQPGSEHWESITLGHRVFFGAGDDQGLLVNADRRRDDQLALLIGCGGDTLRVGSPLRVDHPYQSVTANVNYTRVALSPDLIVIGHVALATLHILERRGTPVVTVSLDGPEVATMRRMYLQNLQDTADRPLSVARDTLVADLMRAAQPERFPVPVYIGGLAVRNGLVYALVNNVVHVLAPDGSLRARLEVAGRHRDELVVIHTFCFDDAGHLLGLDRIHYRKVYDFGPVD